MDWANRHAGLIRKVTIPVILGSVFLIVVLLVFGGGGSGSSAGGSSTSHLALVKNESVCKELASEATIRVFVGFRNTGNASGSVDVTPWRRYSDGSVNQSGMDMFTINVPAHRVKVGYADVGFDSTQHDLAQCGVILGDGGHIIHLSVQQLP